MSALSFISGTHDIAVTKGDTLAFSVFVTEEQADSTKTPLNLTGWTAKMQVKTRSGVLKAELAPSDGITIDAPDGRLDIRIEAVETAALECAEYVYDLQIVKPLDSNFTKTILYGRFSVRPQITV